MGLPPRDSSPSVTSNGLRAARLLLFASVLASSIFIEGSLVASAASPAYPATRSPAYVPTPSVRRPGYLQRIKDPTYRTRVVRISDESGVRQRYSSKAAWNSDGSLLLLDYKGGSREVRRGRTFKLLRRDVDSGSYFTWSNRRPRVGYSGGPWDAPEIWRYRITPSGGFSVVARSNMRAIAGWSEMSFGGGQGSPSNKDLMAVMFKRPNRAWGVAVVDLKATPVRVVSERVFGQSGQSLLSLVDNVGMSHTGRWVSIAFGPDGRGQTQGVWLYRRSLSNASRMQILRQEEHWDWARTRKGTDVFVYRAGSNDVARPGVHGYYVAQRKEKLLVPGMAGNLHVSGRNIRRPGWVYISPSSNGRSAGYGTVFAVNLQNPRRIQYFAHHHHSRDLGYQSEVHASASPNGRYVVFASEWGGSDVHAYVAHR
jgi:hypothetical protein